jgi:hypothetical protein
MQTRREHKLAHLCQGDRRCRIEGVLPILLAELEEENGGGLDDNQRDEGAELLRILRKRLRVVKGSGARARPVCQSRAPPGATRVQVGRGAALTMGNESAVVCHNNGGATQPPPPTPPESLRPPCVLGELPRRLCLVVSRDTTSHMAALLRRVTHGIGRGLRETGQAMERMGARAQDNWVFQEKLCRHRAVMNLFDQRCVALSVSLSLSAPLAALHTLPSVDLSEWRAPPLVGRSLAAASSWRPTPRSSAAWR